MRCFISLLFLGSVLSVPSPCTLLRDNATCANSIGCAWCDASQTWGPYPSPGSGGCYNNKTESCCTAPGGDDCAGHFDICDDSTETCVVPSECRFGGSPECLPVNKTYCSHRGGVLACLPSQKCCGEDQIRYLWCCAVSQTCGTSEGECL